MSLRYLELRFCGNCSSRYEVKIGLSAYLGRKKFWGPECMYYIGII